METKKQTLLLKLIKVSSNVGTSLGDSFVS